MERCAAYRLAALLGVNFYEDLAECHSQHRVGAVFTFGKEPPKERNIIVFDDFVTTGATMISMLSTQSLALQEQPAPTSWL